MCHIVALAAAEVRDNPTASQPLQEFASVREQDAEVAGCRILEKHGLKAPISIHRLHLGESKQLRSFPCLKFSCWVKYLLDTDRVPSQLCGCKDMESMSVRLSEFWKRYEQLHPLLPIFEMSRNGLVDLQYLIPVFSHTDEGRSLKKQALWILSVHGALGRGTRAWLRKGKNKCPLKRNGLGLPFVGPTWGNHFMFACMLRKFFKKCPEALDNLVAAFADDMEILFRDGVTSRNGRITIRCCHLGTKGDLPALARMGRMQHTFLNCPRASSSKQACKGVCWMCLAGQESDPDSGAAAVPFEEMSGKPQWEATLGKQSNWLETPPILKGVPLSENDGWTFFRTDVWHNFHLGIGKSFCASAMVSLMETLPTLQPLSMDDRISWLDGCFKAYCSFKKINPHVSDISRETICWPQTSVCPSGSWHKGSATTHFMQFLDHFCCQRKDDCARDEVLQAIAAWPFMLMKWILFVFAGALNSKSTRHRSLQKDVVFLKALF